MAGKKADGKKAKLAYRVRENQKETNRYSYATRPEDVLGATKEGKIVAYDGQSVYYLTEPRYVGAFFADPNRYGRPASRLTREEAEALLNN